MKNLQNDTAKNGVQMTLFSLGASLASPTALQESDSEKKMTATCGPKCLELYRRLNRPTLWAKTLAGYLVGTGDWYSTRCALTWRLKGTRSQFSYFQLQASTHRTNESGFGLLPTPTTRDWKGARSAEALEAAGRNSKNSLPDYFAEAGKTFQLNPRFVLEMMGFPSDWTLLPFQNGETKQLKQEATQ